VACPPAVVLGGDPSLVADVTPLLATRGISAEAGECPALAVTLERSGKSTLVSQAASGDPRERREVTDMRTAATVIESWVRRPDLEAPLLAHRSLTDGESPDRLVAGATPAPVASGVQLRTLAEMGLASDHTTWVGLQLGACTMVGPACAGVRARFSTVADGPGQWEAAMDRQAVDALVDIDFPVRIGRVGVSSGLGLGLGWIRTQEEEHASDHQQTVGLRAEAHLAASYQLSRRFSLESSLGFTLGQTVATASPVEPLPSDPRLLARFGLGLRFEGP